MRSVAVVVAPPARAWQRALGLVLLALAASGCQRQQPAPDATQRAAGTRTHLQWHGTRRCVDCLGIDTRLTLSRDTGDNYALTEIFHARAGATRFVEHGRWQRQGSRLQLWGDTGSLRVYRLLPDGRLQPRDLHGGAFASAQPLQPATDDAR
jgi:hypothetical protein